MKNLTDQIVCRIAALRDAELPQNVYHSAKRCITDYCAVVLAGAAANREKSLKYIGMMSLSGTSGNTSLFGLASKADIYTAALINGINAHTVELDDGHRFGMMHMGAPVISAVLAAAESGDFTGDRILRSVICGYDIAIALSRQMQPGHKLKGYHATGTCCTVGCAAAIALLMEYNDEQIKGAVSAAATSAAGLLEVIDDGSQLKPYNIGRAAIDGVAAAFTGGAGFKGPDDAIGGKRGFFAALASADDYMKVKESLLFDDNSYAITEIYTKPYAACRHCHPAIEAALNIRKELLEDGKQISSDDVKAIEAHTYKLAIAGHDHTDIQGISSAKMSTPYSVAAAYLYGLAGMNAYTPELIDDISASGLMKKVSVRLHPELDALNPQKRGAIVVVRMNDGAEYTERVDYPRGEPENMMSDAELEDKLSELAALAGKTEDEISELKRVIWSFEKAPRDIYRLLS